MSFLEVLGIVNLIIATQGFFLFFHFILKKNTYSLLNVIMALLCLSFSLVPLNTFIHLTLPSVNAFFIQLVANHVLWLVSPSLYYYVRYQQKPITKVRLFYQLIPYVIPFLLDGFFDNRVLTGVLIALGYVQMSFFLTLSFVFIKKHYNQNARFYAWILPALIVFTCIILLNIIFKLLTIFGFPLLSSAMQQGFTTLLSLPVFYLSYKEMNRKQDFDIPQKAQYKTTPLSAQKRKTYLSQIEDLLINQESFKNPELKLQSVAKQLDIPSKYISQTINSELNMSFSDYVNHLRVEDVKLNLLDASKKNLTIAAIAQESGFKSLSNFNQIFKKKVGLTPKQFQSQAAKN